MNTPDNIADLISEYSDDNSLYLRVKTAVQRSHNSMLAGPRSHGSKVFDDDQNIGLFEAIEGTDALKAIERGDLTYIVFPIKRHYNIIINAVPSYLLPANAKVEIGISPKGTPQVVADDHTIGVMDPSWELVVILGCDDDFITWFPMSEGEEPWEMTALTTSPEHMELARVDRLYRISELESYLGGSFDVVRKSNVYKQKHN